MYIVDWFLLEARGRRDTMQGIVKDDKGAYVKSAIVRLLKIRDEVGESDEEAVTYAETDEDGKFVISDLGPDERYIIEIHIEIPEPEVLKAEPETVYEQETVYEPEADDEPEQDIEPEPEIIDSLIFGSSAAETIKMNLSVDSLYNIGFDPKGKSYLTKNNTW
jgi:hypothetical protein